MQKLTELQYSVIMEAINNAKSAIHDDEFIDPYGDNPNEYTNEQCLTALDEVENLLMNNNNN